MKNIHYLTLLITLVTLHGTTFCMHTKLSAVSRFKHNRTYVVTHSSPSFYDMQKGRRDAYQKWCNTPIHWDTPSSVETTKNKLVDRSKNHNKKEDMTAYYKQFSNK